MFSFQSKQKLLPLFLVIPVIASCFLFQKDSINAYAAVSYTSSFDTAPWRDTNGSYDNRADYTKAPFTIEDDDMSFVFSAGYDDPTMGPRLGSQSAATYIYHDLDHSTLAPFRNIVADQTQAVIAMSESLINARITSFTISWSNVVSKNIHYIYSLDDGSNWSLIASGDTLSKSSLTFEEDILGNRLRLGIIAGYSASAYRYLNNPIISYSYEPLSDQEQADSFMDLVASYTPCSSDVDGLLIATKEIATSLQQQYSELSSGAKELFDVAVMNDGTTYKARLDFILEKQDVSPMQLTNELVKPLQNGNVFIFIIILAVGVMAYGFIKRTFTR